MKVSKPRIQPKIRILELVENKICRLSHVSRFLTAEGSIDELPIHRYTQQHMSAWLHKMRQRLVVEARPFLLKPDYDTVTVGIPLPFPSGSDGIPGSHSPNLGADSEAASASEDGCRLGWGQEGEEAPLLASGRHPTFQQALLASLHIMCAWIIVVIRCIAKRHLARRLFMPTHASR